MGVKMQGALLLSGGSQQTPGCSPGRAVSMHFRNSFSLIRGHGIGNNHADVLGRGDRVPSLMLPETEGIRGQSPPPLALTRWDSAGTNFALKLGSHPRANEQAERPREEATPSPPSDEGDCAAGTRMPAKDPRTEGTHTHTHRS